MLDDLSWNCCSIRWRAVPGASEPCETCNSKSSKRESDNGPISLKSTSDVEHQTVSLDLAMPPRIEQTPVHLRLRLPGGLKAKSATANGQPIEVRNGEWLILKGLPGQVSIVTRIGPA